MAATTHEAEADRAAAAAADGASAADVEEASATNNGGGGGVVGAGDDAAASTTTKKKKSTTTATTEDGNPIKRLPTFATETHYHSWIHAAWREMQKELGVADADYYPITSDAVEIVDGLLDNLLERIAKMASDNTRNNRRAYVKPRDIQVAARFLCEFQSDFATQWQMAIAKADAAFSQSKVEKAAVHKAAAATGKKAHAMRLSKRAELVFPVHRSGRLARRYMADGQGFGETTAVALTASIEFVAWVILEDAFEHLRDPRTLPVHKKLTGTDVIHAINAEAAEKTLGALFGPHVYAPAVGPIFSTDAPRKRRKLEQDAGDGDAPPAAGEAGNSKKKKKAAGKGKKA